MALHENFFGKGFLNRTSWKREDADYLAEACRSDKAKFIILDAVSNPLVVTGSKGGNGNLKSVISQKLEGELKLATLAWKDVSSYFKADTSMFVNEPTDALSSNPLIVFLGIDERGNGNSAGSLSTDSDKRQQSLPKSSDPSFAPNGEPYFVIDTTNHAELAQKAREISGSDDDSLFMDLRAELLCLDFESTGVVAQARALVDWNKRNRFCPACGNKTAPVWGGWKRACIPDQLSSSELNGEERPMCISKKGVHNFAYPRTDPVVIMAVENHSKDKLLLGRNKAWPKNFFSCLAGFVEPGESIEESVRREVWEEAGIRVKEVKYHSSQPWPFPGSLMIGCLATAEPDTDIRTDLDNELESADFYDLSVIKTAVQKSLTTGISRKDVEEIQNASDKAEELRKGKLEKESGAGDNIRIPPKTAIAHTLIRAWLEEKEKSSEGARL